MTPSNIEFYPMLAWLGSWSIPALIAWKTRGWIENNKRTNDLILSSLSDLKISCETLEEKIKIHLLCKYSGTADDHLREIQSKKEYAYSRLRDVESVISKLDNLRGKYFEYISVITDNLPTSKRSTKIPSDKFTSASNSFFATLQALRLMGAKGKLKSK